MYKVLISDPLPAETREILESNSSVEVIEEHDNYHEVLGEVQGWIVRSGTQVTAELLDQAKQLKCVCRAGAGVDNVDVKAAAARDVVVMNTPGANARAAAELSIGLMFALARQIPPAHQSMVEGRWDRKVFKGTELGGKVLGVLGYGKVGQDVSRMGEGLGMQVKVCDPSLAANPGQGDPETVTLEELFRVSDYISLHVPLNDSTRGLVNRKLLGTAKPSLYLVNCARGGVVDEAELIQALDEGLLAGAALDVFESEPPQEESPLRKHPKLILTPHLGASTREAQDAVGLMSARQVLEYLTQGKAVNRVSA